MDRHKKRTNSNLILTLVLCVISMIPYPNCKLAIAEAWLCKENTHQYSYSYLDISSASRKYLKDNANRLNDIHLVESMLYKYKHEILSQYNNQFDAIPNSERVYIQEIDEELKELRELRDLLSIISTTRESKVSVVYGVSNRYNIGLDIRYSDNAVNTDIYHAKAVEFYQKYGLYQGDNSVISIKSGIAYNNYYRHKSNTTLQGSLFWGVSKSHQYLGDIFFEIGCHGAIDVHHLTTRKNSIGFSSLQGEKIFWNMMLSNYSRLDYYFDEKVNTSMFEQCSISKEINFSEFTRRSATKAHDNKVTIQLSYFIKKFSGSTNNFVSGTIISLWFII